MNSKFKLSDWEEVINKLHSSSNSIGIGIFTAKSELLDANEAMKSFMGFDNVSGNLTNTIVNPELESFNNADNGLVFEGLLTIGNKLDLSYSFNSRIYQHNDIFLVYCEAEVSSLFEQNKLMSNLNQEVNNLQRKLIGEKKKLERTLKELKETQQMLIHSEKMNALGKLVAGVAHEINNPIAFIYSNIFSVEKYIQELYDSYTGIEKIVVSNSSKEIKVLVDKARIDNDIDFIIEDLYDITKETKNGVERIKKIVEDLRKFSRLDESEIKNVNLIDNIKSSITIINSSLTQKNIDFKFEYPCDINIECYPGQLNQALLNIIINAIQAVDEYGKIVLHVTQNEDYIYISVVDNGVGIPENILNKIFDPFFTTKPVGTGTGLGLSITYKIISELHHGSIEVNSVVGKGTDFKIKLPKLLKI